MINIDHFLIPYVKLFIKIAKYAIRTIQIAKVCRFKYNLWNLRYIVFYYRLIYFAKINRVYCGEKIMFFQIFIFFNIIRICIC